MKSGFFFFCQKEGLVIFRMLRYDENKTANFERIWEESYEPAFGIYGKNESPFGERL